MCPTLCRKLCVASWCVCTSPSALMTVVGLLDVVKVSNSAEFRSFSLIMCIDTPESTTNSLSSSCRVDGAGRHLFSEGEKNAALFFSYNFKIFLANFHAASRAHHSCEGSRNFCKLLCVSWEVFVLHGYDWIHWVAKSCTTTAYRWLFRDSQPSLRTLWSNVIKPPNFSAPGAAPPMRLLHGALVILVLWQIPQFRSLGKLFLTQCLPKSALLIGVGSKDSSWEELACQSLRSGTLPSTRFSLNSCSHSVMSDCNRYHRSRSWSSFLFGFGFLVGFVNSPCSGFPEEHRSLPKHVYLTLLRDRNLSHTGLTVLVCSHCRLT